MKKKNRASIKTERLIEDESFALHKKKGNGIIRRQIWWCDSEQKVTRYSLAYINHALHQSDNGRVLCYDNAHGYHHRHYMGKIEQVNFNNYTDIEERFQKEFEAIHEKIRKK